MQLVKVLRNTNFTTITGKLDFTDIAEINVEVKQLQSRILEKGDIIVEKSGGSPTQPVGRVSYFDKNEDVVYSYSNFTSRLRANKDIVNPLYLWAYLHDFYRKGGTVSSQSGIRLLNLNNADYLQNKIPLPPKHIQEQIVKEILEIETKEMDSKVKSESLEQDIWTLLLPNFQSGQREKLGIIAKLERGRFSHRPRNAPHLYRDGTYPFIQTGDVAGAVNAKVKYSQTLNEEGLKVSRLFDPNTILITIAANIGNTAILDYPACFPDSVVSIRPNENVNIYYLEYFLRTQKEYLNEIASQSAQKNLNLERLSPLLIPIIPLAQQNEIISQIKIIETKKQEIEQFLSTVQEQKEEVLNKYL